MITPKGKRKGKGISPSLSIVKTSLYEVTLKSPKKGLNGVVLSRTYTQEAAQEFLSRLKGTRKKSQIRKALRWALRAK